MLLRGLTLVGRIVLMGLIGAAGCSTASQRDAPHARLNILLVTIDTLRADRLGRGFTPVLDRLANDGLRFVNARSVVPLTLPAHATIMSGQLPGAHGVRLNGAVWTGPKPLLASRLQSAGYHTMAAVGAFVLDRRFGLAAGFDSYDDQIARAPEAMDRLQADRPGSMVAERSIAALSAASTSQPWLLWAHFYDPHAPYAPSTEDLARAGGDPYNGEIAAADRALGRILDAVALRTDAARTAVVVVGDHGESLGEHGEPTHGMLLFDAALRVPLIVRAPGVVPAERRDPATSIDILPTVLTLAGLPAGELPGRSLAGQPDAARESYAETDYPQLAGWAPVRALTEGRWKLVRAGRTMLFDLTSDPDEAHDVGSAHPTVVGAMGGRLDVIGRARDAAAATAAPSADVVNQLRSLGYVTSSSSSSSSSSAASASGTTDPADVMSLWAEFEGALARVTAGEPAAALGALSRAQRAFPRSQLFTATYARALAATGRPRDAAVVLRRAVIGSTDPTLFHELAVVTRDMGAADEALRAENAALALDPTLAMALNGKGLLLADAGHDADAIRVFSEASRLDPNNAVYLGNLGNATRAAGDLAAAAAAYQRALAIDANLGDALNGFGVVLVQQERAREAIVWLERAARDASFVEAQLNLGIAYDAAGEPARAAAQYRKVLAAPGRHDRERGAARALLARQGRARDVPSQEGRAPEGLA